MEVFQLLPKVRWRRRESATSTSSLMGRGAFCWSFLFGFSLRLEWGWLQSGLTWNFLELFWSLDLVRKAKQPHKIPWAQVGFKDTACKAESSWLLRERAEDTVRRNNGQQVDLCAFHPHNSSFRHFMGWGFAYVWKPLPSGTVAKEKESKTEKGSNLCLMPYFLVAGTESNR